MLPSNPTKPVAKRVVEKAVFSKKLKVPIGIL